MPPKFKTESFDFKEDETVPDHTDEYPDLDKKDPTKFSVEGRDTYDDTDYAVAIDVDDFATAQLLSSARKRQINRTQEDAGSIQDQTKIVYPKLS